MWHRTIARPGKHPRSASAPRRRWAARPVEALEGRALLAASILDPSFGGSGFVLGTLSTTGATTPVAVTAVAVQGDGKILTAEINAPTPTTGTAGGGTSTPLTIHRYNADGSVDATFGTDGQAIIPLPGGGTSLANGPRTIALTGTGQIVVAAEVPGTAASGSTAATAAQDVVARLTDAGALDTTFGTTGVVTLPAGVTGVGALVVEGGGRIVVAGETPGATPGGGATVNLPVLVGLTDAGALDATFGTDGQVAVPLAAQPVGGVSVVTVDVTGLRLTPSGQLLLGVTNATATTVTAGLPLSINKDFTLSRLGADGTIDTTFGTGGTVLTNVAANVIPDDFVVQPDGRIVVVGEQFNSGFLPFIARFTADGAADPAFTPPSFSLAYGTGRLASVAVGTDGTITALGSTGTVLRLASTGAFDTTFGRGGQANVAVPSGLLFGQPNAGLTLQALALTGSGNILVGGSLINVVQAPAFTTVQRSVLAQALPVRLDAVLNDYDGNGTSDLAAELAQFGAFAYRTATGDTVQPFGNAEAIPAPGDYDGDGKADVAAYLPTLGILAYRPSSGGPDVYVRFGPAGAGNAIPAPGDYDGDGRTDVALYLPASGTFAIDPSDGAAPYAVQFGAAGAGASIPAPGDYDGDGRTDLAVYLPASGVLAYRPSGTGPVAGIGGVVIGTGKGTVFNGDVYVSFGAAGAGNSIPAPGDYDGDGRTDVAAYLPQYGVYAYRPSSGGPDNLIAFGPAGAGNAIPVPGDYNGDGKADVALYLPGSAAYAIDLQNGLAPYAEQFGAAGAGNTVPATVVAVDQSTVSATALADGSAGAGAAASVPVYLPDALPGDAATTPKKHKA